MTTTDPWPRYLAGTKAFDKLWGEGKRCPNSKGEARCKCEVIKEPICAIWRRLADLAAEIGGEVAKMVEGIK